MQTLKHNWSDQTWRRFLAFGAGAMVLFYMLVPVAPLRWHDLYLSYGKTAIVALAAIYFFRARLDGVKEVKIHPSNSDRENRYSIMIEMTLTPEGLLAYDVSDMHKEWKRTYGDRIESKAIFDCEK